MGLQVCQFKGFRAILSEGIMPPRNTGTASFSNRALCLADMIQWLGLPSFTAVNPGPIPGWGTKIPQAAQWPKNTSLQSTGQSPERHSGPSWCLFYTRQCSCHSQAPDSSLLPFSPGNSKFVFYVGAASGLRVSLPLGCRGLGMVSRHAAGARGGGGLSSPNPLLSNSPSFGF